MAASHSPLTHLPLGKMAAILADDIFRCIFMNEKFGISILHSIWISLKCVPLNGPIDNKSALVQVMACRLTGDKPLPGPMLTQFTDAYMRHNLGGDELKRTPMVFNTFRPEQNGRHFTNNIFKFICVIEKLWISITISLKVRIDNNQHWFGY